MRTHAAARPRTAKNRRWKAPQSVCRRSPLFSASPPRARACPASAPAAAAVWDRVSERRGRRGDAAGTARRHGPTARARARTVPDREQNVRKLSSNVFTTSLLVNSARSVLCFLLKHILISPSHSCVACIQMNEALAAAAAARASAAAAARLEVHRRRRVPRLDTHDSRLHFGRRPKVVLPHLQQHPTRPRISRAPHARGVARGARAFINWSTFASSCVFTERRQYNSSPGLLRERGTHAHARGPAASRASTKPAAQIPKTIKQETTNCRCDW